MNISVSCLVKHTLLLQKTGLIISHILVSSKVSLCWNAIPNVRLLLRRHSQRQAAPQTPFPVPGGSSDAIPSARLLLRRHSQPQAAPQFVSGWQYTWSQYRFRPYSELIRPAEWVTCISYNSSCRQSGIKPFATLHSMYLWKILLGKDFLCCIRIENFIKPYLVDAMFFVNCRIKIASLDSRQLQEFYLKASL